MPRIAYAVRGISFVTLILEKSGLEQIGKKWEYLWSCIGN